jgi:hypothetical protein
VPKFVGASQLLDPVIKAAIGDRGPGRGEMMVAAGLNCGDQ